MPSILKGFTNPAADNYIFSKASELRIERDEVPPVPLQDNCPGDVDAEPAPTPVVDTRTPIDFAKLQAEAILADARREGEEIKERFLAEAEAELAELRKAAREEGYQHGYTEGIADGAAEARVQNEKSLEEMELRVREFLEESTLARERLLDQSVEEMKELAISVAEKIIRISLDSSSDIIVRMIKTATEKHKRREWVHIYIAGCNARELAHIAPELTMSLGHISDRVRIIPMPNDESGTCIIEMPDEILDASVSTQLANIRDVAFGGGQKTQ